jgi:Zn ribbon nucleic-acid-binding protein
MPIMREENGYNIRECPRCTLEKESIEDEITKRKFKC